MKKVKKHVYHIGDYVEICNPLVFKRVGYPMSLEDTIAFIKKECEEELDKRLFGPLQLEDFDPAQFLEKYRKKQNQYTVNNSLLEEDNSVFDSFCGKRPSSPSSCLKDAISGTKDTIIKNAAILYMMRKEYGGRDRTVHTELQEDLRGKVVRIIGKKVVRTGKYRHGAAYEYGEGYEQSYLSNAKSHVILEVEWEGDLLDFKIFQIEECHVKPWKKETPWAKISQELIEEELDSAEYMEDEIS